MDLFQDNAGQALTEWTTTENIQLTVQQFLRFEETTVVAKKFLLDSALSSDGKRNQSTLYPSADTDVSFGEPHCYPQLVVKDTEEPLLVAWSSMLPTV